MSGRDYLHIWYLAQSAVILFLLLLIGAWEAYHGIRLVVVIIPVALLMLLAIVSASIPHQPHWLELINRWLQSIFQPLILTVVWGNWWSASMGSWTNHLPILVDEHCFSNVSGLSIEVLRAPCICRFD